MSDDAWPVKMLERDDAWPVKMLERDDAWPVKMLAYEHLSMRAVVVAGCDCTAERRPSIVQAAAELGSGPRSSRASTRIVPAYGQ